MAQQLIYGREALRRFREQEARREQAAKDAEAKARTRRARRLWLKANVSPDEYAEFEKLARAAELTLANYVRQRLGLPLTRPGRPRRAKN